MGPMRCQRSHSGQASASKHRCSGHANVHRNLHKSCHLPPVSSRHLGQNRERAGDRKKGTEGVGRTDGSLDTDKRRDNVMAASVDGSTPVARLRFACWVGVRVTSQLGVSVPREWLAPHRSIASRRSPHAAWDLLANASRKESRPSPTCGLTRIGSVRTGICAGSARSYPVVYGRTAASNRATANLMFVRCAGPSVESICDPTTACGG